jgi:aspartyl-tRNA(Asn)/glutamyl-tRNA(Gln) amidotransferase subunit A
MLHPLQNLTVRSTREALDKKDFSALELTQAIFKYIKEKDPEIHAFLALNEEGALKQAEAADLKIAANEAVPPLAGVPLAVKDNILIEGLQATAASKILEDYRASYDAFVIQKLKANDAIFLGKTNLDEFAMGASTENSAYGVTKNPHDLKRVPGGSSGGSAAAVAGHMAVAALGSDTGGSIRQPAAFTGTVGLKPTYGAVSRSGLIALASSLDQIGPITKTVEDAAIIFNCIKGKDSMDSTSEDRDYGELLKPNLENIKKLKIGLPKEYFGEGISPEIQAGLELAIKKVESLGLKTQEVSLPHSKYGVSTYYIVLPAEASANLARFDGVRYGGRKSGENLRDVYFKTKGHGFGPEPKRRIILGTFVLSSGYYDAYYEKAQRVRALIKNDFEEAFKEVDVILGPTTPTTAFKIGEKSDPLSMYLADIFTIPANLAGVPALALPADKNQKGLPVGFQLIGKAFHEADILGLGQFYERI